ncbi:MAG: hypothetical protein PUD20_03840 [bacterium]|nr:hypothetical protein [bacterium]
MLSVILFILKLLGWLLLIILSIFLLLVFTALFVPVSYRLSGEWLDQKKLFVSIQYLFFQGILRFDTDEGEEKPTLKLLMRVFGIPIRKRQKKEAADIAESSGEEPSGKSDSLKTDIAGTASADDKHDEMQTMASEKQTEHTKKKHAVKKEKSAGNSNRSFKERFLAIRSGITDKKNLHAMQLIFHEVLVLIRHFGPRKGSANVTFSMGDPANTGYVTGMLSICPLAYKKGVSICPDFISEAFYVKGTICVRGHARLIHAVRSGIRLIFDRDVRSIILRKS